MGTAWCMRTWCTTAAAAVKMHDLNTVTIAALSVQMKSDGNNTGMQLAFMMAACTIAIYVWSMQDARP